MSEEKPSEKKLITKEAVKRVLRAYWLEYKARPLRTLSALFIPAIGSIFIFYIPPIMVAKIVNLYSANTETPISSYATYIFFFGAAWLLGELLWRVGMHHIYRLTVQSIKSLNDKAFRQIIHRDYDFYTNNFVGSLTRKTQAFSRGIESFTETLSYNIIGNLFPIIFAFVILSRYSYMISTLLLVSILTVVAIAIPLTKKRAPLVAARQDAGSKTTGYLSDAITNIFAVKAFAKEKEEEISFARHVDTFGRAYIKAFDFQNWRIYGAISPVYALSNVVGLFVAIYFSQQLGLEAGAIFLVFTYYALVTQIFWNIQSVYRQIESTITEAAEFTQMLIEPPAIQDAKGAEDLKVTESNIKFENVGFSYGRKSTDENKFLENFNIEIRPGERVGLVGPSGGGKTTITKLILRFLDPQSGKIKIDGQDIKNVTQKSLREAVAYVPQEPLLFHRSLFENIAYGRDNATEQEVIDAAKLAHAHEFIVGLPEGYQTLVGERGVKLSGGQKQRVAIARAILKNSPILVLDEATSSLDSESEKYIQEGLWELMKDKTAVVIAHRLSTIKHLDRILVLENGKITEDGKHEDLTDQPGTYARLWSHQSGEFLSDA